MPMTKGQSCKGRKVFNKRLAESVARKFGVLVFIFCKLLKIILILHDSRKSLICIKDIPDKIGNSNIPLISFHVLLIIF